MRAMGETAGMAWVELVCPHWGVQFWSWVARSAACRERSFCPNPSAARSQETCRARTAPPPPRAPQLSFSFSGVLELGPLGLHDCDLVQTLILRIPSPLRK